MDENTYYLEKRIKELEEKLAKLEDRLPHTGLLSHTFFRRAFTVFGYNFIAGMLIFIPFYLIIFILTALFFQSTY